MELKTMVNTISNLTAKIIEKMNLYKLFQAIWLVEFYVLTILAVHKVFMFISGGVIDIPEIIEEYTEKISYYLTEYEGYILYISLLLLVAGVSGSIIKYIDFLSKYKMIAIYCDFGIYSGSWLLLIWITFTAYDKLGWFYLLLPMAVRVVCDLFSEGVTGVKGKIKQIL